MARGLVATAADQPDGSVDEHVLIALIADAVLSGHHAALAGAGRARLRHLDHHVDSEDVPLAASLAKVYCSAAYSKIAGDLIWVHGGIGFTWEHPAHLYFKRAKTSEALFGTPAYHRDLLAARLGLGA